MSNLDTYLHYPGSQSHHHSVLLLRKCDNISIWSYCMKESSLAAIRCVPNKHNISLWLIQIGIFLCYIMDYSFLTIRIVFSGDRITGNCCWGVCKISLEWRVTVEHVLRIATIYSSYTSIFLPFPLLHITPSFSTSYATFDDIRFFLVAEAGCFWGLRSKCERGMEVGIRKLSLFPSLHFLVFLLLYLLAVKLGEWKAKEFLPPKKTYIGIANKRC